MLFKKRLHEPIHRKILILVSVMLGLCAIFVGVESVSDRLTGKLHQALANETSRSRLAGIMMHELLRIENNSARMVSARAVQDRETALAHIRNGLEDLDRGLTLLNHGGTFTYFHPFDEGKSPKTIETIIYHVATEAAHASDLIELIAGIGTINPLVENLAAVLTKPSQALQPVPASKAFGLHDALTKTLVRPHEILGRIFHEAHQEIDRLDSRIKKAHRALNLVRYGASAVILAAVLLLCLGTLQQIDAILTEKERFARQLHQSNQSIQQVLEALPVGVLLIDENHVIRHINRTALAMMGGPDPEERIGQKCTGLLCSLEEDQCPLNEGPGASLSNEIYLRAGTGSCLVVLRKAIALQLDGKPMVLETLMDISKLKSDEQAMIEKKNYLNKILEAATVGIMVVDGTDFTIVEANPAAVAMIGVSRQNLIGSHCRQWICTLNSESCPVTHIGQNLESSESELRTAEGRTVPVVKNVSMALLDGRMHLVESFVDITRLKEAEEEARRLNEGLEQRVIQRTAQLEKANQNLKAALLDLKETQSRLLQSEKMASIGQLAAGVAHEINNPVGFVKSNLHTIDDYRKDLTRLLQTYESLPAALSQAAQGSGEVLRLLDKARDIKKEIDFQYIMDDFENVVAESVEGLMRVAKIVADLKNFAHMKVDETQWVDINAGIESTLNIVWNQLKYKAEVIKELGLLPQVRCYPQRINQVVMNLLVNASQAIREHGRILIKTSADDQQVSITVSDTGEGIPSENLNKIFDPFFTTKDVGKGTGLGLNVAYQIVASHKGRIDVDSSPGHGTTFRIHLPIDPDFDAPDQAG